MSTLLQQVRATGKAIWTGQGGDDAFYVTPANAVAAVAAGTYTGYSETCRVQFEPWESVTQDANDTRIEHIETMIAVSIGSEADDVANVEKGGVFIFDGFWWSVINIALRTSTNDGWARCRLRRGRTISIGSPGTLATLPGVSPGGRFAERGK